ncbi:hypothetical protein W97_00467 [Coniosporium apollinis CBS 100218]|uniref:DUF7053 domain-containing protein n=1 Tax=Coniosporium apollinis (strain CBS 100218) TaxID=1168221 RepID=R7YHH8_CONA1|nr:uncharacterized protein W97_00467 [Coniosporium apollinis CBS 100218]EON61254.1 hypothetical protein W97_00467 [Coniosporium apollinis CBS 100218]
MSKRTLYTVITPLPPGITRATVIETFHAHVEMIDLNPLAIERHPISPPSGVPAEETQCLWYQITDRISYLPGGALTGKVSYNACFHDLPNGLQTHIYAPLGLDIKGKWSLGGNLPGEPQEAVEMGVGAPSTGLYIREDVEMRCNIFAVSFVKRTLKKAHALLVERLVNKTRIEDREKFRMSDSMSKETASTVSAFSPVSPAFVPVAAQASTGHGGLVEYATSAGYGPYSPPIPQNQGMYAETWQQSNLPYPPANSCDRNSAQPYQSGYSGNYQQMNPAYSAAGSVDSYGYNYGHPYELSTSEPLPTRKPIGSGQAWPAAETGIPETKRPQPPVKPVELEG